MRAARWALGALLVASEAMAQSPAPTASATQPDEAPGARTPLTLRAVLDAVRAQFPLLRAAERDREAAAGERLAAEGGFDPQWRTRFSSSPIGYYQPLTVDSALVQPTQLWGASFFAGYRLGQPLSYTGFAVYDGKAETTAIGELRLGFTLPLWRNRGIDRARASLRRAEIGQEIADLSVLQQQLETARTATLRYWEWVAAGRRLAVQQSLLDLAQARDEGLGQRVARGDIPPFERTDNRRAIVQREGAVVAARRALEQATIELALYLRDAEGRATLAEVARLPPGLPDPPALDGACLRQAEALAARLRPEARRFERQRDREEVERAWADNQRMPAIDLVVAASQDLGRGPQRLTDPVLEAGVLVDIPLRNRTATGRMQVASAAMARADEQARFARDRIAADVRDAASALEAARQRVEIARQELTLATQLAAQERERFQLGEGTLLFVNLREQAATEAEIRVVDALLDGQRALAAWRFATGQGGASTQLCPE